MDLGGGFTQPGISKPYLGNQIHLGNQFNLGLGDLLIWFCHPVAQIGGHYVIYLG